MRFVKSLRHRALAWLAREFGIGRQWYADGPGCQLGSGAVIFPEAQIDNLSGRPGNIVMGKNTYVRGHLLTYGHGGRITIGDWCYVGARSEVWSMASIEIGNRVLIAHDVNIHDGTAHSLDPVERHQHFRHIIEKGHPQRQQDLPGVQSAPIIIEDDVWISFGVTILRGVRIGKGSVIAAGAFVSRDVPPGVLYRSQIVPVVVPLRAPLQESPLA